MKDVQEQEKCAALTMEVGGVMMARLLRTIERPYIYAPEGESGTSEMRVQVEKDYIPWPIGCGVGGICEHCDLNMTCWGCGDFYCQLCLNPPTMFNQWDQCPRNKRLLHYDTCVQRKHGPLCSTCLPKYTTQCSDCKHYFCNLCYPNGIKLESDHVMDDYKNLTKEDLQHHWEDLYIDTLADLSHEFLEPPEAWTVESKPDSGDDDTVDWGDLGTRYTTTVSEVVKQLRKIRERVRFEMEREKNGGGGVDVGEAMNDLEEVMFEKTAWEGYEENEDEEMHNQEEDGEGHEDNGGTRLILGKELGESGTSFHPYHEHDEDAHSVLSSNTSNASTPRPKVSKTSKTSKYKSQSTAPSTDFSPSPHGPPAEIFDFPTGKAYSGRPPHHPSFQSLLLKTLPRFPTYMAEQGLHPVAIYTTCGFCKKTVCGVCTKGRAHVFSEGWDWDRCGGCGEMMCGECCGNRCTLCRRGLCGECYERENKMRKTVVDALPCVGAFRLFRRRQRGWDVNNWKSLGVNSLGSSKGEVQEAGEYCFRCELRQFLAELRNMKKMSGEFYREGVDWEAGRQMVYEDWWAEWREPEKRLVGVMHGREEGGLVSGVKVGKDLGLLCEGVGGEFEVGEAGAAKEGWVPEGGELGIMTFGGV
ncbi:hypothetical protein BDZ91DRAFT_130037 [Kalaharituber pfeilii]|nr:hypothetical protein BDZ91DRAFT_130037 [Kalaharituber pfeilii]